MYGVYGVFKTALILLVEVYWSWCCAAVLHTTQQRHNPAETQPSRDTTIRQLGRRSKPARLSVGLCVARSPRNACQIMYLDGNVVLYFIGVVLDIPRKATLAQVMETVVSRSCRLVNAVATAAVVVHVTMQATFGRPTHLQQVSSPQVRP